ncbi:MAG: cupredoxin domain-containing protein [Methanothrix sp.]|nr:cupredoxin domain-containing protein [Methanothrix sp.]
MSVNNNHIVGLALLIILILGALAFPSCADGLSTGENITIGLVAKDFSFNVSTITVPAGSHVTVKFDNQDSNVRHNFAVYESAAMKETIFKGELISGPKTIIYTFDAPATPGTYHFQCDPHASMMKGQFVVT